MSEQEDIPEELRIFLVEAYENLDRVEQDLVQLEKSSDDVELLNSVFRSIHTIKGNAGFLALSKLEQLCHSAEAVLDRLRSSQISLTPQLATTLLSAVDTVRDLLESIEQSGVEGPIEVAQNIEDLKKHL
ncbi:Hpt domain-containing protein [bacterium]|nr:Hpt domain-containing protein [bacterium]